MNKKYLKILLIFLSTIYLLSFLEVSENESNQNYGREEHSYLATSNEVITAKIICGSVSKSLFTVLILQGVDEPALTFKLSFTNNYFAHLYYPSNKIYLNNSVFLI